MGLGEQNHDHVVSIQHGSSQKLEIELICDMLAVVYGCDRPTMTTPRGIAPSAVRDIDLLTLLGCSVIAQAPKLNHKSALSITIKLAKQHE